MADQVWEALRAWRPDLLLVDVFPRGLMGELSQLPCPAWLLSRWVCAEYAQRFEVLESLGHYEEILAVERSPWPTTGHLGPVVAGPASGQPEPGRVLFLGSGPTSLQGEQASLLEDLCRSLGLILEVASFELGRPASEVRQLLAQAELVVSAAGYNSYHEILQAGASVIWWPQPRLYDEQHRRAHGELGLQGRAWQRRVEGVEALVEAVREWSQVRPACLPAQVLACPGNFRDRVATHFGLDPVKNEKV